MDAAEPPREDLPALLSSFAVLAGNSSIVLGCSVLLIWILASRLWHVPGGLLTVNPTIAGLLVMTGFSLRLSTAPESAQRRLARACAVLVLLLAVAELLRALNPGRIAGTLLLHGHALGLHAGTRGGAALILLLSGLALLMLDVRVGRGFHPAEPLAVTGLGIALMTLVAYGYGIQPLLPGRRSGDLLEINTALSFALITLGILCARPARGLMALTIGEDPGGETVRHLLPAMIMVPTSLAWVRIGAQQLGVYKSDSGSSVFGLASVAIYVTLILWNAQSLHRASVERRKAEREAREAAEMKEDFAAMVSHELRTPLASIKAGIDMVLDVPDDLKPLQIAKRNVDRLTRLINEVLDFRKLEAGKEEIHPRPCELNAVVSDAARSFDALLESTGLKLRLSLAADLPPVFCDPDKIEQVVVNLVGNALKFSPAGGAVVIETAAAGAEARVTVRDQGPGIEPDDQAKLFKSFSQLRDGKKKAGSGLGLAICRQIVARHEGRVGVDSEPGRGAAFWFTLPLRRPGP